MDMSQYLDVFLEESKEHLSNLNAKLLELEKKPNDLASLNEIFRAAHTLKGMSSTMGFEDMADLTHHMEDVLADLKEGQIEATTRVIDVLFKCFDRLQVIVDRIQNGLSPSVDNSDLNSSLKGIKNGLDTEPLPEKLIIEDIQEPVNMYADSAGRLAMPFNINEFDCTLLREADGQRLNSFWIQIKVDPSCMMKSVRVFMVFKALEEDGDIIKTHPASQDLDEGNFQEDFHLILLTRLTEEAIRAKIDSVSEITVGELQNIKASDFVDSVPVTYSRVEDIEDVHDILKPVRSNDNTSVDESIRTHKVKQTVRVDIEKLDNLMNLVGELVINKGRLEQIGMSKTITDLNEAIEQMERITNDLQSVVMKVRMVPIEQVFNRFPRMVRDLAKDLNKEVEFVIEGKETELDRTVIDEIGDPLVHLLRNALDHGIESPAERIASGKPAAGLVNLNARHEGNNVFIEVIDDGRGLNIPAIKAKAIEKGLVDVVEAESLTEDEIIKFMFNSGFSTAKVVTDVSGRGVGLDVVKNKIESLNGEIFLENRPGNGTVFKIRLPLTLAIIQALLVGVGDESYAIPLTSVDETTMIEQHEIKVIQSQEVVLLRGTVLPLARARTLLSVPGDEPADGLLYIVVVRKGTKQMGLVVDSLIGQQEIVIKSLGKLLAAIPGIAGATMLGDGGVSLILDVGTLI
ncbi:MAG: chemotaxis protein CheW [Ignavibacteriales bacterium]